MQFRGGEEALANLLIKAGADVNKITGRDKNTMLSLAISSMDGSMIRFLMRKRQRGGAKRVRATPTYLSWNRQLRWRLSRFFLSQEPICEQESNVYCLYRIENCGG